jgi:hypothetical protein
MARIIGGIAASHTPTIGFALDNNRLTDPVWQPIFDAFEPAKRCPRPVNAIVASHLQVSAPRSNRSFDTSDDELGVLLGAAKLI